MEVNDQHLNFAFIAISAKSSIASRLNAFANKGSANDRVCNKIYSFMPLYQASIIFSLGSRLCVSVTVFLFAFGTDTGGFAN